MAEYGPTPTNASAAVCDSLFIDNLPETLPEPRPLAMRKGNFSDEARRILKALWDKVEKGTQHDDRMDDVSNTHFACACVYDDSSGTANEETF